MEKNLFSRWLVLLTIILMAALTGSAMNSPLGSKADNLDLSVIRTAVNNVDYTVINDPNLPWIQEGTTIRSCPEGVEDGQSCNSTLTFNFSIKNAGVIWIDWSNLDSDYHSSHCYLDGELIYSPNEGGERCFKVSNGNHSIQFVDSISDRHTGWNQYTQISRLDITDFPQTLNPITTTENNVEYVITNVSEYPWVEDVLGISTYPYTLQDGETCESSITTNFTTNNPGKILLTWQNRDTDYHSTWVYLDGNYVGTATNSSSTVTIGFDSGSHTIEIIDSISDRHTGWSQYTDITRLDIIEYRNWIEVPATANGITANIINQGYSLQEVHLLKVTGEMNATCFEHIKQLANLYAVDMSEATAESIPSNSFYNDADLTYVLLPKGLKTIGSNAFRNTKISTIELPNTLQSIGDDAFEATYLTKIAIPNSVTSLGSSVFYNNARLTDVVLSDSLTSISYSCFQNCRLLTNVKLPKFLEILEDYCFQNCSNLLSIYLPESLEIIGFAAFSNSGLESIIIPKSVTSIESNAFSKTKIKEVVLPPYNTTSYSYTFSDCSNLEKVTFTGLCIPQFSGIFSGCSSNLTVVVPPISLSDYQNDTYFNSYNIVAGEDTDYWPIFKTWTLENDQRTTIKPDVEFTTFSSNLWGNLTVNGDSPLALGKVFFPINHNDRSASIISNCNSITADTLATVFEFTSTDRWYFLTPLTDVKMEDIKVEYIGSGAGPERLDYVFRYYDSEGRAANGTGDNWKNVSDPILKAGIGYIFRSPYQARVTLPGTATTKIPALAADEASVALASYTSEYDYDKNWNLVGNPYACYYDIIWLNYSAPIIVWNTYSYRAYTITDDEYALHPGQAFFVQKPDDASAMGFRLRGRQTTATINHTTEVVRQKNAGNGYNRYVVDLTLSNGEFEDETRLVINEEAQLDYELSCDASKLMSMNKDVPQMYTIDYNNARLAINERPVADGECLLGVYLPSTSDEYAIRAPRAQTAIYLYDKETGAEAYLSGGTEYLFTTSKAGYVDDRFILRVAPTSMETLKEAQTKVIAGEGYITVVAEEGSTVTITGIDGIQYYRGEAETVQLQRGVYVVTVNGKNHKVLVK